MGVNKDQLISMLVLSCDNYSDLWDDFFNLREKFWPDCPYKWYVVTESKDYNRDGVEVIKCGKELNWAARYRMAVRFVNTPYVASFLEDYFIASRIDNNLINSLVQLVNEKKIDFLRLGKIFRGKFKMSIMNYYSDHLLIIPKHQRYGLNTAPAIWRSSYLLAKLGNEDYNAWRFEKDRCDEAATEDGYTGLILVDDRFPINVSQIPVVIQGKFYPPVISDFKKRGYLIDTKQRGMMTWWQVLKYDFKVWVSNIPVGHKYLKWFGKNVLGYTFFTKD